MSHDAARSRASTPATAGPGAPRRRPHGRRGRGGRVARRQRCRQDHDDAGDLPDGLDIKGSVTIRRSTSSSAAHRSRWCALGIAHVPQGRGTFPELTVEENLRVRRVHPQPTPRSAATSIAGYQMFPRLGERRAQQAGSLSGGEQQMLAVAAGADEPPAAAVAGRAVARLGAARHPGPVRPVRRAQRRRASRCSSSSRTRTSPSTIADRAYVLEAGQIVLDRTARPNSATTTPCAAPTWGSEDATEPLRPRQVPGSRRTSSASRCSCRTFERPGQRRGVRAHGADGGDHLQDDGHLNFAQGEMAMFSTFIVFVLAIEQGSNVWLAIIVVIGHLAGGRRGLRTRPRPASSRGAACSAP